MKRLAAFIFLFTMSLPTYAHVKWFVEDEGVFINNHFNIDLLSGVICLGALSYILLGAYLQLSSRTHSTLQQVLFKPCLNWNLYPLLKFSLCVLLLANLIQGNFIAPNITVANDSGYGAIAQAALIILLAFDGEAFAIVLALVAISLFYLVGFDTSIDYFFELISIAIAVGVMSPKGSIRRALKVNAKPEKLEMFGLSILRIGLGLQLCTLALHDKLLHPGLSLHFLEEYPYFNFMKLFGVQNFTDMHFVLSAGLAEFSFGLLLIANIAQRMASLTILFFFTLTGIILGLTELMGHVPIIAAVIILLIKPAPSALNFIKKNNIQLSPTLDQ